MKGWGCGGWKKKNLKKLNKYIEIKFQDFSLLESTNQDVAKGTERVHAQLAPLVGEKSVFQPLVDHGVDFLQPVRRSKPDVSRVAVRRTDRWTVG